MVVLDDIPHYGAELERTACLTSDLSLEHGVTISTIFVRESAWEAGETPLLLNLRQEAVAA